MYALFGCCCVARLVLRFGGAGADLSSALLNGCAERECEHDNGVDTSDDSIQWIVLYVQKHTWCTRRFQIESAQYLLDVLGLGRQCRYLITRRAQHLRVDM